jgi:hypothetical protein
MAPAATSMTYSPADADPSLLAPAGFIRPGAHRHTATSITGWVLVVDANLLSCLRLIQRQVLAESDASASVCAITGDPPGVQHA